MFRLEALTLLQILHFMHRINQTALDSYRAMNHHRTSGPDPQGHAFIGGHFITEQSAERLQTKDPQPPLLTLPHDPWREVEA